MVLYITFDVKSELTKEYIIVIVLYYLLILI